MFLCYSNKKQNICEELELDMKINFISIEVF